MLKLIKDNFHPGDSLVETNLNGPDSGDVEAQAFLTPAGHKLLLANKRDHIVEVKLPDALTAKALTVDESTGDSPAHDVTLNNGSIRLASFAVSAVSW